MTGATPAPGFTEPPLIHFTTADLGNMADGRYNFDIISDLIRRIGAIVLVTKEHLIEFQPLAADSRERRFALSDKLPMALVHWRPTDIWISGQRQLQARRCTPAELHSCMFQASVSGYPHVVRLRHLERRMGEAEFFGRTANRLGAGKLPGAGLPDHLVEKFQKFNEKHGSNVRPKWESAKRSFARMERLAPLVRRVVPRRLQARIAEAGLGLVRRLDEMEPQIQARLLGVDSEHLGFQLWWETRKKLRAKTDEVGGLGERIDLHELKLWPVCAMITVDKRVHNAVMEALRTLQMHQDSSLVSRFVRAGTEKAVVAGLEALLERRRASGGGV